MLSILLTVFETTVSCIFSPALVAFNDNDTVFYCAPSFLITYRQPLPTTLHTQISPANVSTVNERRRHTRPAHTTRDKHPKANDFRDFSCENPIANEVGFLVLFSKFNLVTKRLPTETVFFLSAKPTSLCSHSDFGYHFRRRRPNRKPYPVWNFCLRLFGTRVVSFEYDRMRNVSPGRRLPFPVDFRTNDVRSYLWRRKSCAERGKPKKAFPVQKKRWKWRWFYKWSETTRRISRVRTKGDAIRTVFEGELARVRNATEKKVLRK